jgi:hypothetical protein
MATSTPDELAIQRLIGDWVAAVRCRDYDGVLRHHALDIIMFEVPEPFFQRMAGCGIPSRRAYRLAVPSASRQPGICESACHRGRKARSSR